MSQLAREFPEEYAAIAALPPSEQNAAERDLASRMLGRNRATGFVARSLSEGELFDSILRALDRGDIRRAQILSEEWLERDTQVERECRDCGTHFQVPADKADVSSKWYSLCPSCLQYEI